MGDGLAVEVRVAVPEDVGGLKVLLDQLDRYHAEIQPGFFRVAAGGRPEGEIRRAVSERGSVVLVAELAGALIGAVSLRVFDTPDSPLMVPQRRALLEDMVVDGAARRRGVGRALAEASLAWCRERGVARLVLTVWQGNESAERFYEAVGLRPVSRIMGIEL